jgi:hypothetical protein
VTALILFLADAESEPNSASRCHHCLASKGRAEFIQQPDSYKLKNLRYFNLFDLTVSTVDLSLADNKTPPAGRCRLPLLFSYYQRIVSTKFHNHIDDGYLGVICSPAKKGPLFSGASTPPRVLLPERTGGRNFPGDHWSQANTD